MRSIRPFTLAVVGLCVLATAGCAQRNGLPGSAAVPGAASDAAPPLPTSAPELERDYVAVVARVLPSVVQITTEQGLGSGVVFDKQGDIVTNDHVVGNARRFQVRLASSPSSVSATLVGVYPPDDLAVIN